MHHETPQDLIAALQDISRARRARRRAENASSIAYEKLESLGFSKGAVDRALDLIDSDAKAGHEETKGAQELLSQLRAPVQIEFAALYESDLNGSSVLDALEDEGYWACMCGASRTYRAANEAERAAWMRGYDLAASTLTPGNEA